MVLSIGMIVKNEECYFRRCLEALSPVLKQVQAELIIADTGSTDGTAGIANEYTRNVFSFEWRDDFSAARNATMKKAKGEWFMFIDADEILQDTKELIRFFNSGEYKKYNSAAFIIRNMSGAKTWSDFNALRLIKLSKDSYFVNAIHEQFGRIYEPVKFLPVIAHHYGYDKGSREEFVKRKMKRNLQIMYSELEKNPGNPMFYLHIGNCLRALGDYDKALMYCCTGLEKAREQNDPLQYSLYASKAKIYVDLGDYPGAVETCDGYFLSKQAELGTDIDMHYLKADCCYKTGRRKDAVSSFKRYLDFYAEFKKGKLKTIDTLQHSISFANDYAYSLAVLRLADLHILKGDFPGAEKYLHALSAEGLDIDNLSYLLKLEMNLMEKKNDFSGLAELYGKLDGAPREALQTLIENDMEKDEYRGAILEQFAGLDNAKDHYFRIMKLRSEYDAGKLTAQSVEEFVSYIGEWTYHFADAVYFALEAGLPLIFVTSKINAYDTENFFCNNIYYHCKGLPYLVHRKHESGIDGQDTNTRMWVAFLYFSELTSDHLRDEDVPGLFSSYSKLIHAVLNGLFREEALGENIHLLPKRFRAGYYCAMAADALEKGKNAQYIKYLREALKLEPQLQKAVEILAEKLKNRLDGKAKRPPEFEAHAAKVKETISALISNGNISEASQLISSYESIYPEDKDIAVLKNRIKCCRR